MCIPDFFCHIFSLFQYSCLFCHCLYIIMLGLKGILTPMIHGLLRISCSRTKKDRYTCFQIHLPCRHFSLPYVGMIQIRFMGLDIYSLLSARSAYGLPCSIDKHYYTTLLIFAQCIVAVICCIINIFYYDIISIISVRLYKHAVSDFMSLDCFSKRRFDTDQSLK